MLLIRLAFYVVAVGVVFHFATRSYLNPYKLIMVFGKKGSGKTTFLTKTAQKYLVQGKKVYSTVPISGTVYVSPDMIGYVDFDFDSVLLIDEVGLIWHNRDWKSMDKNVIRFFKYQRHYGITCYLFSQSFDVDKTLRDLCDSMWLLSNKLRVFSVARRITKRITVSHPREDENGQTQGQGALVEDYAFAPPIFPSSWIFTFIPRWSVFFDSFSKDLDLKKIENTVVPYTTSQFACTTRKGWYRYELSKLSNRVSTFFKKLFSRGSSRSSGK